MRLEGKANSGDLDKLRTQKANKEDIEIIMRQVKGLEKQINFLEDDNQLEQA